MAIQYSNIFWYLWIIFPYILIVYHIFIIALCAFYVFTMGADMTVIVW